MANYSKSKVNPNAPIFLLKIGDTDLTLQNSPEMGEYVISFSKTQSAEDTANDIKIRLFDKTALMVEWYIVQGYKRIEFQYGMDESNLSRRYVAHIKNYEPEFTGSGHIILTLDVQLGELGSLTNSEISKAYENNSPSAIVQQIAQEEGWKIGKIVTTQKVAFKESYLRQGQTAEDFIRETLIKDSVSLDGKTDYTFYLDFNTKGETCCYFLPKDSEVDYSNVKTYEFIIGSGNESEIVISFTPNYDGVLQHLLGGDSSTNTLSVETPGMSYLTNTIVGSYPNGGIKRRVGSSTYNDTEAGKVAEYLWTKMAVLDNTAQLVLRGDASFYIQAYIVIVVLTPDGYFHHSSGLYQVLTVSDDIEGGNYTTTLELVKRSMQVNADGTISPSDPVSSMYKDNGGTSVSNSISPGASVDEQFLRRFCNAYNGCKYSQDYRTGTSSYDCSSVVNAILGDMGIKVPWSTTGIGIGYKDSWGTKIWESGKGTLTVDMIKPGYIGLYNSGGAGHTWIFINNTTMFHAANPGDGVLYQDLTEYYVKQLNSKPSGRAVVWAPPTSTETPIKNNGIKSRNYPNLN